MLISYQYVSLMWEMKISKLSAGRQMLLQDKGNGRLPGAELAGGFKIKSSIRGVESNGMICSFKKLDLKKNIF